jgi:hypothetical protein
MLEVTEPSELVLSNLRPLGMGSLEDLGKFISPVLDNSNGELCVRDQSKPPRPFHHVFQLLVAVV